MRWTRWILIVVSVVAVLFGTALLLLLTVDLGRFKGHVEDFVTEATGRDFVIDGHFNLSVGRSIELAAEDVRLANADWGTAENILELERLVVSIDTGSLLSHPVELLNLEVEGLEIHVERDSSTQQSSWSFDDDSARDDHVDEGHEAFELPVWLERARFERIGITYGQGWLDEPRTITISAANISSDESDLLTMGLAGAVGEDPIAADGLIGPLSALLDGKGLRWELQATVGQFLGSTDGTFRNLFDLDGPDVQAAMRGPSAERVLARFGLPALAHGPVNLELDITEHSDGIELRADGEFGDLTTNLTGNAKSLTVLDNLELTVDIRGPNLKAVGELFDAGFLPSAEFLVDGAIAIADESLRFESVILAAGEARVKIDGTLTTAATDPDARVSLVASGPALTDFMPPGLADRAPSGAFDLRAVATGPLHRPQLKELNGRVGSDALVFELDDATVDIVGLMRTSPVVDGVTASIGISSKDLQSLLEPWVDVAVPSLHFEVEGVLEGSDRALKLSNVVYRLGEIGGTLEGTTGTLPSLDGLRISNSVSGNDISELRNLLADPEADLYLPAADFETHTTLSKTPAGWFADSWLIRIGDSRLEMQGELGDFEDASGLDIDIEASGPDLRLFVPDSNINAPVPYEIIGGMKISDTTIELQQVDLRIGETTAWLDGRLPTSSQLMDAEFDVRVAGPNLQRIGQAFGVQTLPADAFRFEGAMTRSGHSYLIDGLTAVVGKNDLGGKFGLTVSDKLRISGNLESRYLNISELLSDEAADADVDAKREDGDRLIPDTPLPLAFMDIADVDVTLRMQELITRSLELGDVEVSVHIRDDTLRVDTTRVTLTHGGALSGTLDLVRTEGEEVDLRISADARQYRLRPPVDSEGAPIRRPPQDLKLELAGSGKTIRELAAGVSGSVDLRAGEGSVDNELSGFIMRDFASQLFSTINPLAQDSEYTKLNCGFLSVDVVDGVATSRAVGFQTDELAVASVGTVNLATEELDLSFRVKQREGVGVSLAGVVNPYVKVGGTLASPALEIDTRRGLLSGTVAVITGGLSILAQGVWDRFLSQDDYCEAVLEALDAGELPALQDR